MLYTKETHTLYDEMMEKATRIGKLAESEAKQAEVNSTISQNVVDLIREEEIHRLLLPKEYGYPQLNWQTYADMISKVGYYNLSAAWITCFFSLHNAWVSYLPKPLRDEIVESGGFVADVFAPVGKVEPCEGGYRISGTYHFVSGIKYSDWVGVGAFMKFDDADKPERVGICLKVSDCEIVDSWDSMGLRGTGSHTLIVDNVFFKPEQILRFHKIVEKPQPPEENYDQDYLYYNQPFYAGFYIGFAAMALGGARRIIDEFKKHTVDRIRFTGVRESESPSSQRVLAELCMEMEAAEALMRQYIDLMNRDRGNPYPYEAERYKAIRAMIIKKCSDIGYRALLTLGGHALLKGHPVEMFTRDLIAIATHITSLYEDAVTGYGRHLFGIETGIQG